MSNKLLTIGVVLAIVIAGFALFRGSITNAILGSATVCTDGYTCLTNLEVQGNLITDGTLSAVGLSTLGSSSLTGTTTMSGAVNFNAPVLCINFYATSTATRLKLVASTTPTLPNGAAAVMVAQYGSCTSS